MENLIISDATGINGDFSAVSKVVIELLQGRDAGRFAKELSPGLEDWKAVLSGNAKGEKIDPIARFQKTVEQWHQKMSAGATQLLARADSLHVDFSKGNLHARALPHGNLGKYRYLGLEDLNLTRPLPEDETLPWVKKLEIVLRLDSETNNLANGDFKLAVHQLIKFPGGWRCIGAFQWVCFPSNITDAKTAHELTLLAKAVSDERITGEDDPALLSLGDALVHFIRERDTGIFKSEAYITNDMIWAGFQQFGPNGPSRKELDDELNLLAFEQMHMAQTVVELMENAGVDLKNADIQIKETAVERTCNQSPSASVVMLVGDQFKLALAVKTEGKSRNGTPLSGDYILAATRIMRFGDDWKVGQDVHWLHLPPGVLDGKTAAKLEFENSVVCSGTLPPQTTAPEIEFITLEGEQKMKLSDLRGKVVVLLFWTTRCGACQAPMTQLKTLRQSHPNWQDKVAIIPLSIDDSLKTVRARVEERGWSNMFNVWAGDGGWHSPPATAFRVRGVPTAYIIDSQGQIVEAGSLAGMDASRKVDDLLGKAPISSPHAFSGKQIH